MPRQPITERMFSRDCAVIGQELALPQNLQSRLQSTEPPITAIETLSITDWRGPFAKETVERAQRALEIGKVLYFPALPYVIDESCADLLAPQHADKRAKNISYDTAAQVLKGTVAAAAERIRLQAMMASFSAAATRLVAELLPSYAASMESARASFRPVEIAERESSRLKDDRLLHVDAFPSSPTRGRRILRLFCNIDPLHRPRVWHIGEPFERFAQRFLPGLGRPMAAGAWFLKAVGATRGRRTVYDQLMLGLHDSAKRDPDFQNSAMREEVAFAAGSSWLCFTDQVLHAAMAGQYALEQTFYVDVEAMVDPGCSPVRTLERITGRRLC